MPLSAIDSSTAVSTLKSNGSATWPSRGGENRLSPIAKPRIRPKFQLDDGESVFTIGSCFARNVERELQARGFVLPALDAVQNNPDFRHFGSSVLNNYGTPSIFNEIGWALEREYRDEECFVEVGGKWVDMHLPNFLRPADLDTCRLRRRVITESYRQIPNCRVIIITLGLSEIWFDAVTGTYLNAPPRRGVLRQNEDRFKLHVLSFAEAHSYLKRALELIRKHGREDVRVLLTVSPVPLSATHRDMDVMEANSYSKSVLRTAAEHIRSEYQFVDYYPSYESVTLSERAVAWQEDEVHVSPEIVSINIERMVGAYTESEGTTLEDLRDKIKTERASVVYSLIESNRQFLAHRDVASAYVRVAVQCSEFAKASEILPDADDPHGVSEALILNSQEHFDLALNCLDDAPSRPPMGWYKAKMEAFIGLGDLAKAKSVMREWTARARNAFHPYLIMARALKKDRDEMRQYYELAIERSGSNPLACIEYAERLLSEGQTVEAKKIAGNINADNAHLKNRVENVMQAI